MAISFFKKTGAALSKTRAYFSSGLESLFSKKGKIDAEVLEALEELLLGGDMGVSVTMRLMDDLKAAIARKEITDEASVKSRLKQSIQDIFAKGTSPQETPPKPTVSLFIGVNGVGKTTSIGKIAHQLKSGGNKVILAAADTFRAGAANQLEIWGQRAGVDVIRHHGEADPAAVAFDAVSATLARKADHLLIDTAGRLQTKHNLMEELKKMRRVIAKQIPDAPHKKILVVDATTGQNALSQAEHFQEAVGLTDIILTKLDGSGRGGIIVPIVERLGLPISHVGIGEDIEDLIPFSAETFVDALFETGPEK